MSAASYVKKINDRKMNFDFLHAHSEFWMDFHVLWARKTDIFWARTIDVLKIGFWIMFHESATIVFKKFQNYLNLKYLTLKDLLNF